MLVRGSTRVNKHLAQNIVMAQLKKSKLHLALGNLCWLIGYNVERKDSHCEKDSVQVSHERFMQVYAVKEGIMRSGSIETIDGAFN